MRDRLAAVAGVDAVAFASSGPLEDFATTDVVFTEEHPPADGVLPPVRSFRFIGPGTFRASGTRLVAGRDVTWDDLYQHQVSLAAANADLSRLLPVWLNAWPPPAGVGKYRGSDG